MFYKRHVVKSFIFIILIIDLIMCVAFADEAYGSGYVKRYKPAEDKAIQICQEAEAKTEYQKYVALTTWLNYQIGYDYVRVNHLRELTGPDIKFCFDKKRGVCMDIAALACCMFRAVGIDANVGVGYVSYTDYRGKFGPFFHAWCELVVDGQKITYDQYGEQRNLNKVKTRNNYTYKLQFIRK